VTGYLHGYDGLGGHLDLSAKSARALDRRVHFPRYEIPGIKRETVLFKISEVDETLLRYRAAGPVEKSSVDVGKIVADVLGRTAR
jgi:hypothetical protein